MTDEQIEKGLECCERDNCNICPYNQEKSFICIIRLAKDSLDFIKRLKAENEKLKAVDNRVAFCKAYDHLEADYKRVVKEKEQIREETAREILMTLCAPMDVCTETEDLEKCEQREIGGMLVVKKTNGRIK